LGFDGGSTQVGLITSPCHLFLSSWLRWSLKGHHGSLVSMLLLVI